VAYIFGLGALLVFRSSSGVDRGRIVALDSLLRDSGRTAGVEAQSASSLSLWQRIKQQVKLERVSIPIPNFPKRQNSSSSARR